MNVLVKNICLLMLVIQQSVSIDIDSLKSLTVKIDEDVSNHNCNETLNNLKVCKNIFLFSKYISAEPITFLSNILYKSTA